MIPAWEILSQCVSQAQDGTKIDLTSESGGVGIPDDHILAVKVPYARDDRQRFSIAARPALVFVAPLKVDCPIEGGTDQTAIVYYHVLAQILHTSLSIHTDGTLQDILKWEQQVRRYFHMSNLRAQVLDSDDGMMTLSSSGPSKTFDIRDFHMFDDCISAIPITFKCWEAHDTDGRV